MKEQFYNKLKKEFAEEMQYIEINYENNNLNFKKDFIERMSDKEILTIIEDDSKMQTFINYFLT